MKYILLMFVGIVMHGCAVAQSKKNNERVLKEREMLKNYAVCSCLANVLPEGDSLLEVDGTTAGYFELGSYSIDVYPRIDSIAKIYSSKEYPGKGNRLWV